ncbi:hypothetical protein JHN63_15330 [Streptomyces sp. MBT65]|uniref:hypothetical protein n=1 Tax=Streptomyces sp. MBT65 TaxID=1488395 RepID=UPI00190CE664|nr:hypothetical protein [Streptomyces sp. MBT65]MBK3575159.1 hypothetical protein [Streptomyces sp. MBT65]
MNHAHSADHSGTGAGQVSGNTFNGPVALQTGPGSVQHNYYQAMASSPLDAEADELARAVHVQWQEEAALRRLLEPAPLPLRWRLTERKMAGRVAAATGQGTRRRFAPLPGLPPVTGESLRAGGALDQLYEVYGGLASGRLQLVGNPAAGKTSAGVLLLLDALEHRRTAAPADRAHIPVPVMLPLDGWDPAREGPVEWVVDRLSREYTLFAGRGGRVRARKLVEAGRVAPFLDSYDEVHGSKLRGAMASALELAPFRLVLISRSREASASAHRARLGGAATVEIQPVCPEDAAAYLLNTLSSSPSPAWRALTERLLHDPGSVVAETLTDPLAITLVRDGYADDGPVDELLALPTPEALRDHLLDRAVAIAYARRDGHPHPDWSPETAERTLRYIARHLTGQKSRNLCWWHLPGWTRPHPRRLAMQALVTLVGGVPLALLVWMATHSVYAWLIGLPSAYLLGMTAGLRFTDLNDPQPLPSAGWRDIFSTGAIVSGVVEWLGLGTLASVTVPFLPGDRTLPVWLCFLTTLPLGFTGVLVTGRGHGIVAGAPFLSAGAGPWYDPVREHYNRPPEADTRSIGPHDVWRHHLGLRLVLGLLTGLAVALMIAPLAAWWLGPKTAVVAAVGAALPTVLMAGLTSNLAVATVFTAAQLRIEEGTPLRLIHFLEDARRRNLLRASGTVYQFRHARLQQHLARDR